MFSPLVLFVYTMIKSLALANQAADKASRTPARVSVRRAITGITLPLRCASGTTLALPVICKNQAGVMCGSLGTARRACDTLRASSFSGFELFPALRHY